MKNPQSLAEKLYVAFPSAKLKTVKDNSCCVLTFMWCMGYDPDDVEAIITVSKMLDKGVIDVDCCVYWSKVSKYLTGRDCWVEKPKIKSIAKIKERTPVYYQRTFVDENGVTKTKGHWVGVEKGKIRFNALEHSLCVEQGKPVEARILHFEGGA